MKYVLNFAAVGMMLAIPCVDVHACPTVVRSVRKAVVVEKQAVIASVVAVPVLVPTYTAAYQPDSTVSIAAELRLLREEISRYRGTVTGAGTPNYSSGAALLGQKCASCHGATVSEKKGGGFTLVDEAGKVVTLGAAEKRRVINRTHKGQMPPEKPLVEEEAKAIKAYLEGEGS